MFETDTYNLGSYYLKIKGLLGIVTKEVDSACLLEKYAQDLGLGSAEGGLRDLVEGATKVLSLASDEALLSGKNPDHVARAALCLMVEVRDKTTFNQNLAAHNKTKYEAQTIRERYAELKVMMVKLAMQVHYLTGVTEKNVIHYIPEILDFFWVLKARQALASDTRSEDEDEEDDQSSAPDVHSLFSPITVATPYTPHHQCEGTPGEIPVSFGEVDKKLASLDDLDDGKLPPDVKDTRSYLKRLLPPPALSKRAEEQQRMRALPIGPGAYQRNLLRQQDWEAKVAKAEKHLKMITDGEGLSPQDTGSDRGVPEFGSLGEEELAIQRLLLSGKSSAELLKGAPLSLVEMEAEYEAVTRRNIEAQEDDEERELKRRRLNSEEVTADDMPDEEVGEYIKTKDEVESKKRWDALMEERLGKAGKK